MAGKNVKSPWKSGFAQAYIAALNAGQTTGEFCAANHVDGDTPKTRAALSTKVTNINRSPLMKDRQLASLKRVGRSGSVTSQFSELLSTANAAGTETSDDSGNE